MQHQLFNAVFRFFPERFFNAKKLVVLRDTIASCRRAKFRLTCVNADNKICDEGDTVCLGFPNPQELTTIDCSSGTCNPVSIVMSR